MDDDDAPTSILSSSIPSLTLPRESDEGGQENQFLMTPTEQNIAAPHISSLVTSKQPGWIDRSPGKRMKPMEQKVSFNRFQQERGSGIICHKSYERNRYASNCVLPLRHQGKGIQ